MKNLLEIQTLFTPIQPSIKSNQDEVGYQEVLPITILRKYIYCYWQLKTQQPLREAFKYKVVSDACIDILWEVQNPNKIFINGFSNTYTEFPLSQSFNYVGIRFLPTTLPILFKIDASELTNNFTELENILPKLYQEILEKNESMKDLMSFKTIFDNFFAKILLQSHKDLDSRIAEAIYTILHSQGVISLEKDLDVGLSPRQLRRLFKFYVGDSPKTFAQIVRFQNILRAKPSRESLRKNKLFYDLGYYDQAHFIKEFKRMYGMKPTLAFL